MGVHTWEIKSWFSLESGDNKAGIFQLLYVSNLHAEKRKFLILIDLLEFLVFVEKSGGGWDDVFQFNAPQVFKLVNNCSLFVQGLHNFLACHVIKTKNTVTDSRRFNDLNPSYFGSVVSMSTAASLNIYSFNVYNSDSIARNNATLVKSETELLLCFFLILKVFSNFVAFQNYFIGLVFYLHFYFLSNWWVMGNIKMSVVLGFLGTVLPNMWA